MPPLSSSSIEPHQQKDGSHEGGKAAGSAGPVSGPYRGPTRAGLPPRRPPPALTPRRSREGAHRARPEFPPHPFLPLQGATTRARRSSGGEGFTAAGPQRAAPPRVPPAPASPTAGPRPPPPASPARAPGPRPRPAGRSGRTHIRPASSGASSCNSERSAGGRGEAGQRPARRRPPASLTAAPLRLPGTPPFSAPGPPPARPAVFGPASRAGAGRRRRRARARTRHLVVAPSSSVSRDPGLHGRGARRSPGTRGRARGGGGVRAGGGGGRAAPGVGPGCGGTPGAGRTGGPVGLRLPGLPASPLLGPAAAALTLLAEALRTGAGCRRPDPGLKTYPSDCHSQGGQQVFSFLRG
ncbi:translation initiation factor IF-2-like [Choloepus didactylus]|uniref:translation initiation factor IF-2-like n=1 Tax=Choloepus didactylus TaxID=27675 RepID=UPI00189E6EAB|nr:translation initiation factor IF-2-like [Choloepus didactylus]